MRVLICGSRDWTDENSIHQALFVLPENVVIIEGEARGADSIARDLAEAHALRVEKYPAYWRKYGAKAGPIRNAQMLIEGKPDFVIFCSDDLSESKGTADMIRQAQNAGIDVVDVYDVMLIAELVTKHS